jgi:type VI secretion system secreted protein VgrG
VPIDFMPASPFIQGTRHLRVQTGLGDDVLLLRRFSGVEGMSRLFHFDLDLLSHNGSINPQDIVGDNISICIQPEGEPQRFFNGFVKSFQYLGLERRGLYAYKAEVVPWFWFLSKRTDCRVYQNQTVQEIVESIFNELGFSDYVFALVEQHPKLEYCVQYNESDLDFISRLLEHEGIYYFIEHQPDKNILHLSDDASHYSDLEPEVLEHSSGMRQTYQIRLWQHLYQYCSGAYAQTDFDFEKFNQSLLTETSTTLRLKNNSSFPRFEFPGCYRENELGRALTKLRMQQEEMNYERVSAASNIHMLEVGKKFILKSDENEADHNKMYVITEIHHNAYDPSYMESESDDPPYTNQFVCLPSSTTFRPACVTPKPRIDGVQTAVVVGKAGDEIYTDKYGRIKLQFHWDRYGAKDETSSCWVRVATQWAGNKWGSVTIPRVGQEVVVTFVNGDPDQPLVIGSVYNSAHMPPYPLPDNKSMMGMKSRSSKGGDGGTYNELVIDDKKDSEEFRINAQKNYNMKVGKDSSTHVLNNHTGKIDGNSDTTVQGNTTHKTQGNDSFTVSGNRSATVGGNQDSTIGGNATETVAGDQTNSIGGNTSTTVGGNDSVSISSNQEYVVGASQSISVGANQGINVGANQTIQVGGKQEISAMAQEVSIMTSANMSALQISQTGQTGINLSVGAASISMTPASITLSVGPSSITISMATVMVAGPIVKLN